jgi:predicted aspartyl protease
LAQPTLRIPVPYPSLGIRFRADGVGGETVALVDTGFDGHLAIPEALAVSLPQPTYVRRVRTASGEIVHVPVYVGTVELVDQPGLIDALIVALGDEYLIGLQTTNHFRITFDHGQRLIVEP